MAYEAPALGTAGQVYTAAAHNIIVNDVLVFAVPPMVFATQSSGQVVPRGTWTALQWGGADSYDTDSMHDPATNNTRITINTAGVYLINFQLATTIVTNNGALGLAIRLNGGTTPIFARSLLDAAEDISNSLTGVYSLAATNYIEAFMFHVYGTASMTTDHNGGADGPAPTSFSATLLGRTS